MQFQFSVEYILKQFYIEIFIDMDIYPGENLLSKRWREKWMFELYYIFLLIKWMFGLEMSHFQQTAQNAIL